MPAKYQAKKGPVKSVKLNKAQKAGAPLQVVNTPAANRRRRRKEHSKDENKTYLTGMVYDMLPGARFKVRIERSKGLEPLLIECSLKTMFKARNIKIIRGDSVEVEIDPAESLTKGTIVSRL